MKYILIILLFSITTVFTQDKASEIDLLFLKKIKPILKVKCWGCHGEDPKKIKGEYIMLDRERMLKGGESGKAAITPGDASKSYMMNLIRREDEDDAMPPKEAEKLTSAQIGWIEDWINAGAPWPDDKLLENDKSFVKVDVSGALSKDWAERRYKIEDIWSFMPVKEYGVSKVKEFKHPVDCFVQEKLDKAGLKSSSAASKEKLIRRAYLDLTGMQPSFEEVEAFVADKSIGSYENLIDSLLSSPRYGERQARIWLDVARYADSSGYANDYERPNAWRYRDYVIRSFNQDKPYDRFVKEQIAGDEIDDSVADNVIATGFLRLPTWEHTSMSVTEVTRQLFLDDVVASVGETFLGQPLGCAKCHDHKFDPIPTKDYYRIQAVFADTQFAERKLAFQPYENLGEKELNLDLIEEKMKLLTEAQKKNKDKNDLSGPTVNKQWKYFSREKLRYKPLAYAVYNGPFRLYDSNKADHFVPKKIKASVAKVNILTGGSIESPGEKVTPGVLSAVYKSNDVAKPTSFNTIPNTLNGKRLAFANWVASPQNTLTSRVIVNRIWQQHFSKGIVATPNSFGKMGAKPTHPELLDYLAGWFVENGWSIKKLHKFIMMSKTYQKSYNYSNRSSMAAVDPDNKLLAYFPARRQEAEMIYDSLLKMTGELNLEMGGPGVFPEINWEVALQSRLVMGSLAPVYQPSVLKKERHKRQIYAAVKRSISNPLLEVFNKPGTELSCGRRDETTITPQAFSLFNAEFIHNRSLALANKLATQSNDETRRVVNLFKAVYGRLPSKNELKVSLKHLAEMKQYHLKNQAVKKELFTFVDADLVSEKNGEAFTWRQELNNMRRYERDLMPWEVDESTRALAELCLVLFNSNEFLYVY